MIYKISDYDWDSLPLRWNIFPFEFDQWFSVKIETVGNEIKVYLDENLTADTLPIFEVSDPTIQAEGEIDLYIRQNSHLFLDDILVIEKR